MKSDSIFIGDIKKCTKYESHTTFQSETRIGGQLVMSDSFGYIEKESELYKHDAILIKTRNGRYVDLENLNSYLDLLRLHMIRKSDGRIVDGLMIDFPCYKGQLFIDSRTLRPYKVTEEKSISLTKLKEKR